MNIAKFRYDIEQNSEAWNELRLGKITASASSCFLVGKDENELSVGALTYARLKAAEIITGESNSTFSGNDATEQGHAYEPLARERYDEENYTEIKEVGFVQLGDYLGCSPDGVLPELKQGTEFKCFSPANHLLFIDKMKKCEDGLLKEYSDKRGEDSLLDKAKWAQIQFSLMVTGYDTWSISFFSPKQFGKSTLITRKVKRCEETIRVLKIQTELMIKEIKRLVDLIEQ